jgi:hypothetical protein
MLGRAVLPTSTHCSHQSAQQHVCAGSRGLQPATRSLPAALRVKRVMAAQAVLGTEVSLGSQSCLVVMGIITSVFQLQV